MPSLLKFLITVTIAALLPPGMRARPDAVADAGTAAAAEPVRVATLNVRNYLLEDRMVPDLGYRTGYPKPESEKEALRSVFMEVQPDIAALQEMGGRAFLGELQRDLRSAGLNYPHGIVLEAADPVRHLAVLSRFPPVAIHRHTDLSFPYRGERLPVKRGLLELQFGTGPAAWTLFVVHLKSRFSDRDDDPRSRDRRVGEAEAIRRRIIERVPVLPGGRFLVTGDFNDGPRSRAVRRFLTIGDRQISRIVAIGDDDGDRWTWCGQRDGRYEQIDFILAEPAWWRQLRNAPAAIHDSPAMRHATDHRLLWIELTPAGD